MRSDFRLMRDAGLSYRAAKALLRIEAKTPEQAASKSREELLALKNCGEVTVDEIAWFLAKHGLCLRGDDPGNPWTPPMKSND